jgi:signal transduction histidine kinase
VQRNRVWIVLVLAGLLFGTLAVVVRDSSRLVGRSFPGFLTWDNGTLVALHSAAWTGPRAGLPLNGGRLVAVDGEAFRGGQALLARAAALPPGTPVRYRIAFGGVERDYVVETMRLTRGDYLATFGNYLGNAAVFFLISLVALYMRIDLRPARVLAISMVLAGLLMTLALDYMCSYRFVRLCQMIEATTPAGLAYFALVFPTDPLPTRRRRVLVAAFAATAIVLGSLNGRWFYSDPDAARGVTQLIYLLLSVSMIAVLGRLAWSLFRSRSSEERMKAGVVFSGAMAAFLFPSIAIVVFFLREWTFSFTWITALLFFFPLSVLYALLRYDLLGVERFIRLTVGYTFATVSLVLLYALVLTGLDLFVPAASLGGPASAFFLLIAIAVLFDPLRRRAQRWVDRVFFRSTVDVATVLEGASADLAEIADQDGIVAYVSERLCDALSLDWSALAISSAEPVGAELRMPVSFRGEPLGAILCGPKRSGAPFSLAERELVRSMAAQTALALHNARSIQELREAQATVIRTERLAVIGEFTGSVAHGIRNPLAGIRAAAQIAQEQAGDSEVGETLKSVLSESDRLEQRVRTLLDFSRPFEPRLRPTDLRDLMQGVRSALARQAERQGVRIEVEVDDAMPPVEADPDSLEEAVLELAGNALRAMPDGGVLQLRAERRDGQTVIDVRDTGTGIPPGVHARIFELFFTTRQEGTGMGLATVKKIVERLGGQVRLEDSGPEGTHFRIWLP